jgi:hypothetical protein
MADSPIKNENSSLFGNCRARGMRVPIPESTDASSFDGHKMTTVGQTKEQVESVLGKPDRTRLNSDGTSAELFVPDKWKFAAGEVNPSGYHSPIRKVRYPFLLRGDSGVKDCQCSEFQMRVEIVVTFFERHRELAI